MKIKYIILLFLLPLYSIVAEIQFNAIALSDNLEFLFNSKEIIAGQEVTKTLFSGLYINGKSKFNALTFYPKKLIYSYSNNSLYIVNNIGIYQYDFTHESITKVFGYPNFEDGNEYNIRDIQTPSFSPNYRYLIATIPSEPAKGNIFLYDLKQKKSYKIVSDIELTQSITTGTWSADSNYFIYQKNGNIYYFSISDFITNKLLNEDWRIIGNAQIKNSYWSKNNFFFWIEKNLIYKSDPNQFFSRSIYRKYLKQGKVIGKIPVEIDPAFDSFYYNDASKKVIVVKNGSSIFYYSLLDKLNYNPYLQLNDNMRFDDCVIFDSGEAILSIDVLTNGEVNKKIFLLKKVNKKFVFIEFDPIYLKSFKIEGFATGIDNKQFVVYGEGGAYCFDFASESLLWKNMQQRFIQAAQKTDKSWILGGKQTTIIVQNTYSKSIFVSSFKEAGFVNDNKDIYIKTTTGEFTINKKTRVPIPYYKTKLDYYTETKNNSYRLLTREIKKGYYKNSVYLKNLYSGKLIKIIGEPKLLYKLFQPEIVYGNNFYDNPLPDKYEVALVFNCIKTAEGIFPIIKSLSRLNIKATFFINGNFMEINPVITKELSVFNFEIGNLFQYYVDLTDSEFQIDENFIRQGLSTNEENYYRLTGKNFAPIWHTPKYSFNTALIEYAENAGYKFISYNLDSLDWVGENNRELHDNLYLSNAQLINRIIKKIKPGQIIIFNVGKNASVREQWLFNSLEILLYELIRSGYTFTTASDIMQKYRD